MLKDLKNISTIILLLVLTACNTLTTGQNWPSDVPDREIFVQKFLEHRKLKTADPKVIEAHLVWIVRFYHGTLIYPNGWNRASERFLASIDTQQEKEKMAPRLYDLGIQIANEWARDNEIRRINSMNVATWGSALRTSAAH